MLITRKSMFTGKEHTLDIPCTQEQLDNYINGMLIQQAMPNLPPELREFVMTGVTPEEWAETFGDERTADWDEDEL